MTIDKSIELDRGARQRLPWRALAQGHKVVHASNLKWIAEWNARQSRARSGPDDERSGRASTMSERTLIVAIVTTMLAIAPAAAQSYSYVPTERDRAELSACSPTTAMADCVRPVALGILAQGFAGDRDMPSNPQMAAMFQKALKACGAGNDNTTDPAVRLCVAREVNKFMFVMVAALTDVLVASGRAW